MKRKLSLVVLLLGIVAGAALSGCNKPAADTSGGGEPSTNAPATPPSTNAP
ncbi:MAG: hypothetical protein ABSA69_08145 [Verrucomicrobiota bacterium]